MKLFPALLITMSVISSTASASSWSDSFYTTIAIGYAEGHGSAEIYENRFNDAGVVASIGDYDDDRYGWQFQLGYQIFDYLALEASFIDLEDGHVRILADNNNISSALQATDDLLPEYDTGWGGAVVGFFPFRADWRFFGKVGSHHWDGGEGRDGDSRTYYSIGADYGMTNNFRISAEVIRLSVTQEKTELLSVGFTYYFNE